MTWFQQLTGFAEDSVANVQANLTIVGDQMISAANDRHMRFGKLETPSLRELRDRATTGQGGERLSLTEVVADVQDLHGDIANQNSLFQVASQFNLLEMVAPSVIPEDGVGIYENDRTQGPACAIACGAGTIFRNYFVNVNGQTGQTADNQVDCLADLGTALGNDQGQLWQMRNGYALATEAGLQHIADQVAAADESERDQLRQRLRVGVQWNTEVTIGNVDHNVSHVYCSALPVAYSRLSEDLWEPFAQLVLEAAYEATFCAAIVNLQATGCNQLYLTLLGGGAFGNRPRWIFHALERSLNLFVDAPLQVAIVSYGASLASVRDFVRQWNSQ